MINHLNKDGNANMVDVSNKVDTKRTAKAMSVMKFNKESYEVIKNGHVKKGDILSVAQVAGIMGAKKTADIIPMCHPLNLSHVNLEYEFNDDALKLIIYSEVSLVGKTGVEMEALTAVSVAALTVYDMVKAIDKGIIIETTKLLEKTGGKSGTFKGEK